MANYKIEFFGWCVNEEHDKVWGYASIGSDSKLYNFWGARGGKFTFKRYDTPTGWERNVLEQLVRKKTAPGRKNGTYQRIDPDNINKVIPNFAEEFEHQLALAKLFDNFHGERVAVE